MRIFSLIICVILFAGCNQKKGQEQLTTSDRFELLINGIPILDLPFTYDLNQGPQATAFSIKPNSADTLFISAGVVGGLLPDTSNFYCVFHYQTGDLIYPYLSTFDKQGNVIDSKKIGIGQCGGYVVEIDTCVDRVTVNERLEIESYFFASGTAEDSSEREIPFCNSSTGKGKVTSDGRIELEETEIADCI